MTDRQTTVLDARAMDRTLRRMADEIVELNDGTDDLIIVGIQRRGVQLAARIVSSIRDREKAVVPSGALDITLSRDAPSPSGRDRSSGRRICRGRSTASTSSSSTTSYTPAAPCGPRSTSWPTSEGQGE